MRIDVSIVVICYNQENIVAETLESIKYQIETYPRDDRIQLIIADDASNDKTIQVVEKWLAKNARIFADVCKLFAEKNQGTSVNLHRAVRHAEGKYLLTIAGDDLFSNEDVIERYKKNPDNGLVACAPYAFENGRIITNKNYYKNVITTYYFSEKYVRKRAKYTCPVINGAIVGRDFFCMEALEFAEKMKILDDQARFMKAMELIPHICYGYAEQPVLLYRISMGQVTRNSEYRQRAVEDKKELTTYASEKAGRLWVRYAIFCEYMRLKNRKFYKLFLRFFNFDNYYVKLIYWKHRHQIEDALKNLLQSEKVDEIEEYISMIQKGAREYLES